MAILARFLAPDGALLVIDLQEKLLAVIAGRDRVVANAVRLAEAAHLLGMPLGRSEQNPRRLGASAPAVAAAVPRVIEKMAFRVADLSFLADRPASHPRHVTLAGIEAHVCVAQTALELLSQGYRVQVVADAVASRSPEDRDFALRRLEASGAVVTTTEAVLFEWIETADHPQFKAISALVKQSPARRDHAEETPP